MTLSRRSVIAFLISVGAFALYLHTAGPTLVPYRDAGEMATSIPQLGVLHPPGYPLYTLVGHLFSRLPLANPAYRLNALSALAMALAWGVFFVLASELWGMAAALLTVLLGIVSFQFWIHALVSEMYTLNLLVLSGLLWLLHKRKFDLAAFVFGLGLGIRMDLLLCGPALAVLFLSQTRKDERIPKLRLWLAYSLLGASVFLYLLVRSKGMPLLNWGDPSTLERFWASITRRSYGSSLDLLSKSFQMGENFWSEFRLYGKHVGRDFSLLSFPLAALGLFHLAKTNRMWFGTLLVGWIFTGPLFIFLGNLPPNPHAVAIMEAAYLVPDIFFLGLIGAGLAWLTQWPAAKWAGAALIVLVAGAQAQRFYPAVSKRHNWVAADFTRNVFNSLPEPSWVVAHSDVPTFSLFYGHWIYPGSKWRVPIAQGLAASPWYQVMMNRQMDRLAVQAMTTGADWEAAAKANPGWSLYGTMDTEWPQDLYDRVVPSGLVMRWMPRGKASVTAGDDLLQEFCVYRGRYRYDAYYEFFTPELIEEYANAWMEWGRLLVRSGQTGPAIEAFRHALAIKPEMPYPAFQLGFIYFQQNQFSQADRYYQWCVENFQKIDRQAQDWKAAAPMRASIRRDEAQAMAHWGVVQERKGDPQMAVQLYQRALKVDPECADARYNLAVIYWRSERWVDVVQQLQALSATHPEDPRWRVYLPKALEHLKN